MNDGALKLIEFSSPDSQSDTPRDFEEYLALVTRGSVEELLGVTRNSLSKLPGYHAQKLEKAVMEGVSACLSHQDIEGAHALIELKPGADYSAQVQMAYIDFGNKGDEFSNRIADAFPEYITAGFLIQKMCKAQQSQE